MSDVDVHNPYAPPAAHVASAPVETVLKRRSLWLMLLFFVVTLGLYYPVWFFRRRRGLNQLDSPRKLPLWPLVVFASYFVLQFVLGLMTGDASIEDAFGAEVQMVLTVLQLSVGIMMVIQCFAIKDIIEDHAQGPDHADEDGMFRPHVKLSGLMTFFFSIFYLQYAINKYVVHSRAM